MAATVVGLLVFCAGSVLGAAEWGDLRGKFVFDGPAPVPEKAKITSDEEVCCKHDVVNESLLVDPVTKGVQNIVIVLTRGRTDKREVPVHESYEALKSEPVQLDNKGCRFEPHIALVWTARKVAIANSDPIGHNVNLKSRGSDAFNETIPSGSMIEKTLADPQRIPIPVACSIHPWMSGYVVVRDHPYMAITGKDGTFEIKNVPAGQWQFMVWHEAAGYVSEIKRNGSEESWSRGIIEVDITPQGVDLGTITVTPDLFEK
jgi:hypothetical protein